MKGAAYVLVFCAGVRDCLRVKDDTRKMLSSDFYTNLDLGPFE